MMPCSAASSRGHRSEGRDGSKVWQAFYKQAADENTLDEVAECENRDERRRNSP